jgi:TnpA family transposase
LNAFRDLRSGKEHDNPSTVLAAILADGTNLGLERMANASEGVSYAQLAWTHNWYLSPENYQAALAMIISAHHELPFARHWGAGTSSSSDGQFFRSGRSRSGAADVNAKYGAEPGVKIYSHLSDHFASFGSRIMSATAGEAPYVLDGLVLGAGNLPLHEHYTDTGGATDHVFALCHLLGFRFAPRLRDIGDRKLGSIAAPSTYKGIENLMGRTIKTAAIEADWDDIVRIVASIKDGTVAPSVILRKLAAYKRQNRLDFALAELGRIERTLFTLDWLEQPELRRACQAGLNKGEARHTLAAAIYTNRQGRFTDRLLENQEFRASGLNLLIAAILLEHGLSRPGRPAPQRCRHDLRRRTQAGLSALSGHRYTVDFGADCGSWRSRFCYMTGDGGAFAIPEYTQRSDGRFANLISSLPLSVRVKCTAGKMTQP